MNRNGPPLPEAGIAPGLVLLALLPCLPSCAGTPRGRANAEQAAAAQLALREAAAAMIAKDPKAALLSLDQTAAYRNALPTELRGEIEIAFGEANLQFARQLIRNGGDGSMINGCLTDAVTSLQRAERTLPQSSKACLLLARALRQEGKNEKAIVAATRAIERISARQGQERNSKQLIEPLLLRAEARIPELARLRQEERKRAEQERARQQRAERGQTGGQEEAENAEDASGEAGDEAQAVAKLILVDVHRAQSLDARQPQPYELASRTYRWLGRIGDALRVLEDGIRADPTHWPHHLTLQQLYFDRKEQKSLVGLYKSLDREVRPKTADVTWFLGRALFALADAERDRGDRAAAEARYDEAGETFARCARMHDPYRGSCDIQRALCAVSKAGMALDEGDEEVAEAELDRAFEVTPEIAAEDEQGLDRYYDSFRKSYRGGVYALGARFMGGGQRLERGRRFFRKITQRHPSWGAAWNNLGLACRDLGTVVGKSGDKKRARTLYEESFAAYKKAAIRSPDDPRVQNDCGLMLVYHLDRDHDFAIAQFEKAIQLGTAQLEELPAKTDDEERSTRDRRIFLEEAVGDAWQNWGHLHELRGETAAALEKYRKAAALYPYQNRTAAQRIPILEAALGKPRSPQKETPRKGTARAGGKRAGLPAALPWLAAGLLFLTSDEIERALAKLAANDPEAALELIEPHLQNSEDPEAWYVAGRASFSFARLRMQQGGSGVDENLIDAAARLRKSDALTRKLDGGSKHLGRSIHLEPALYLVETLILQGKSREAWEFGQRHLQHLDSVGLQFEKAALARLMIAIADAGSRTMIAEIQAGSTPKKELETARSVITRAVRSLEEIGRESLEVDRFTRAAGGQAEVPRLFRCWSNLEEWTKRPVAAVRAAARGARLVGPVGRGELLQVMLGVVGRQGFSDKALEEIDGLLQGGPPDAATIWYRGYAWVLKGNELRLQNKAQEAPGTFAKARRDLARSAAMNAAFKDSANWWSAMSWCSEGWCAQAAGRSEQAEKLWVKALQTHPGVVEQKDALDLSVKDGFLTIGGAHFQAARYVEGTKLMETFMQALGRKDVDALNNIGLFLREHATRLPEGTGQKRAYRRSYAAYEQAVALDPENPRLLNDAALIDVYYLHENRKAAEAMLRRAIEVGQDRLDNEPPAGEGAKRALDEAVGDARMNLGLLLIDTPAMWDEAEQLLRQSLAYWPNERRASKRHLRRLQRERRKAKRGGGDR